MEPTKGKMLQVDWETFWPIGLAATIVGVCLAGWAHMAYAYDWQLASKWLWLGIAVVTVLAVLLLFLASGHEPAKPAEPLKGDVHNEDNGFVLAQQRIVPMRTEDPEAQRQVGLWRAVLIDAALALKNDVNTPTMAKLKEELKVERDKVECYKGAEAKNVHLTTTLGQANQRIAELVAIVDKDQDIQNEQFAETRRLDQALREVGEQRDAAQKLLERLAGALKTTLADVSSAEAKIGELEEQIKGLVQSRRSDSKLIAGLRVEIEVLNTELTKLSAAPVPAPAPAPVPKHRKSDKDYYGRPDPLRTVAVQNPDDPTGPLLEVEFSQESIDLALEAGTMIDCPCNHQLIVEYAARQAAAATATVAVS